MGDSDKSGYVLRLGNPEDIRQARLLLGIPEPRQLTPFRVFAEDWFRAVGFKYVCPENESRHIARLNEQLGHLTEETLWPGDIQRAINDMKDLGPASKNKVRSCGARIVDHARLDGKWRAGNPFTAVKRLNEPKRQYQVLSLEEARRVLPCVREDRRRMFRVAAGLGPRKGELFGMRKEDVDLVKLTVHIRRSHERNQTKTGRERLVPIPACVVEDMRAAIQDSKSEYVFPAYPDGTPFTRDTKLTRQLKDAMGEAGVVLGFDAICRRKTCRYRTESRFRESIPCPKCGFQLWLVPRVRHITFRDLRHTAATLHREAGADPLCIKLLLGHANTDPTDDVYSHLSLDFQRKELAKLKL